MHDVRSRRARALFEDAESRARHARTARMTSYGAAIALAAILVLWFIPAYRELFAHTPPRLMAIINGAIILGVGLGSIAIFDRILPRRFTFLASLPPPDRD